LVTTGRFGRVHLRQMRHPTTRTALRAYFIESRLLLHLLRGNRPGPIHWLANAAVEIVSKCVLKQGYLLFRHQDNLIEGRMKRVALHRFIVAKSMAWFQPMTWRWRLNRKARHHGNFMPSFSVPGKWNFWLRWEIGFRRRYLQLLFLDWIDDLRRQFGVELGETGLVLPFSDSRKIVCFIDRFLVLRSNREVASTCQTTVFMPVTQEFGADSSSDSATKADKPIPNVPRASENSSSSAERSLRPKQRELKDRHYDTPSWVLTLLAHKWLSR
jgi:hypothetical protein